MDDEVTTLLADWQRGEAGAEARLVATVHRELRSVAAGYLSRERRNHTLQPTALINEAYVRLTNLRELPWVNRVHFYGMAARVMRQVLVDYARRRNAAKREGFVGDPITLSGVADITGADIVEVIDLHDAIDELSRLDSRQADIVTSKYFGGLTIEELAAAHNISIATVKRELLTAKLWLRRRLRPSQ